VVGLWSHHHKVLRFSFQHFNPNLVALRQIASRACVYAVVSRAKKKRLKRKLFSGSLLLVKQTTYLSFFLLFVA